MTEDADRIAEAAAFWDAQVETFDEGPDHGLRDPSVAEAWRRLLLSLLPDPPADVLDLGCGTGSLSCLLSAEGFGLHGVDISPGMIEAARAKAARLGVPATFEVGDASDPRPAEDAYDVVLVRHVLWALPDPDQAAARWVRLLRRPGRLVVVEGFWHTGAGLPAARTEGIVRRFTQNTQVLALEDESLWGGAIHDERYAVVGLLR